MTSLVGTVVGIVLTFGTTFYVEKKNKAEMAHQTVVITLHNLDAKIKNLKESTAWMNHIDTLFQAVLEHTPTDLDKMNPDTLLAAYDGFIYLDIRLSENVAESIFSNSIEVWEYMDDERIIGRISNCYMTISALSGFSKNAEIPKTHTRNCPGILPTPGGTIPTFLTHPANEGSKPHHESARPNA